MARTELPSLSVSFRVNPWLTQREYRNRLAQSNAKSHPTALRRFRRSALCADSRFDAIPGQESGHRDGYDLYCSIPDSQLLEFRPVPP